MKKFKKYNESTDFDHRPRIIRKLVINAIDSLADYWKIKEMFKEIHKVVGCIQSKTLQYSNNIIEKSIIIIKNISNITDRILRLIDEIIRQLIISLIDFLEDYWKRK